MQHDTQGQNPRSAITSEEQARRPVEVDFARSSVRYEGGTLPDEIERINTRYIAGEIDSGELTVAILSSHMVQRS